MDASYVSDSEGLNIVIGRKLDQMRVAFPGKIVSFNAAAQTATVQPSVPMKVTIDNETKYVPLPILNDIPVVIPHAQTAGYVLTLPIQAGDTCICIVPDKAMDSFLDGTGDATNAFVGGPANVSNVRSHNLADSICIPGLSVGSAALPEYNTENIELRDKERQSFISLGPQGIEINDGKGFQMKIQNGGMQIQGTGNISMQTPQQLTLSSQNMNMSGNGNTFNNSITLTSGTVTDGEGVVLGSHTHTGVQAGGDSTGSPNK